MIETRDMLPKSSADKDSRRELGKGRRKCFQSIEKLEGYFRV